MDKEEILYNEIVGLRKDIKDILEGFDKRISILESLKDKAIGAFCFISIVTGLIFDFIKERFM